MPSIIVAKKMNYLTKIKKIGKFEIKSCRTLKPKEVEI
jgi:hypothetical protein